MANTFITGGLGTMADAANNNGGGFGPLGPADYTTCQGANGGPTSNSITWEGSKIACTVTDGHDSNQLALTRIGGFVDCVVGTLVYIEFVDATYADDWYQVIDQGDDYIDIPGVYISDKACDCKVGGAFVADDTGIAAALALLTAESGDEVHFASNISSPTVYPIAAEITTPAVAGTAALPFRIYGVDHLDGTELTNEDYRPI
ncbi:MAG: hypothetical protein KAJ19_10860, partial [Gammaproteobacteria bacterium]|nr:hypothetical protein [Gammaproteobacteria bacterium]